jgi:hypothetical protein
MFQSMIIDVTYPSQHDRPGQERNPPVINWPFSGSRPCRSQTVFYQPLAAFGMLALARATTVITASQASFEGQTADVAEWPHCGYTRLTQSAEC